MIDISSDKLVLTSSEIQGNRWPYEQAKLRMLNAAHSTLAYLGLRLGYRSIAEAVGDPVLLDVCRRLFAEDVVPSLDVPPGVETPMTCATLPSFP